MDKKKVQLVATVTLKGRTVHLRTKESAYTLCGVMAYRQQIVPAYVFRDPRGVLAWLKLRCQRCCKMDPGLRR